MTTRRHLDILLRSNRGHLMYAGNSAAVADNPGVSFFSYICDVTKYYCTSYGRLPTLTPVEETVEAPTLQHALFWMNIYRDLLAVDETALQRMRALIADGNNGGRELYYIPDVELVVGEIERVRERLDHWLGLVDRLS